MKKRLKRMGFAFAALLFIAALLAWDGRVSSMMRFLRDAHEPALSPDFGRLEKLLPQGNPVPGEMYAGLPHPFFSDREFVWKLWTTSNRPIHGYRFYSGPIIPAAAVQTTMVEVLSKKESYRAYRGAKACGGYHADFALRLESGGKSTWFLVCLGCGEVLIYSDEGELICELERDAERRLEEAWKDHQGIPFVSFSTRLPIDGDTVSDWGFYFSDAWDSNPVEWHHKGASLKAFSRAQPLTLKRTPDESPAPPIRLKLEEEAYETSELAELRLERYFGSIDRARRPEPEANESTPVIPRALREGFSYGKHVYWITADKGTSREEVRRALDLVRRYCGETEPREVRSYR